ncbi:MAG: hypothetical protein EA416_17545 [Trueperaceae bacterium]|nr:MAG: hypothetical protein EA416_17545 [Trueperaceae bacterium]
MNRGTLPLARWLLIAAVLIGVAMAQQDDAYLDRYDLAIDNLQRSVEALPTDAILAREEIDRAFSALLTLSREAAAGPLAAALERVVERARTAIGNASVDDLAVQVAVLEGGFQRLVFDAALRSAAEGDLDQARARLGRLATDLGMAPADQALLADTDQAAGALRFDFEAGVADVIATRLAVAQELAETNVGGAYRSLARAYGAFLLVQDSPRTSAALNQGFVDAAQALVDERTDDVVASIAVAREQIAALGQAARARQTATATPPASAVPSDLPSPATPPLSDAEAPPADTAPDETLPAETAPDETVPAETPVDAEAVDEGEAVVLSEEALAALRLEIAEELRRERLDVLERELALAGVGEPARPGQAEALLDAGYLRLSQVGDAVVARVSEALAAAQRGDEPGARQALGRAATSYDTLLSPIVRARFTLLDVDTGSLLRQLADEPGLRASDVAVAAGQLDLALGALTGATEAPLLTGARQTLGYWGGVPRAIVLVVLGILALIPLVLANIAFGGGNRNWQLVGVALFLLLLPALFEGLVGLSVLLSTYADVTLLATLPALSPFASTVGQVVWASTVLLALVFAMIGLYGICAQFGLVGRRRPAASAGATSTRSTRSTRSSTTTESIDWDDD